MNHVPNVRRRARLAAAGASALCALLLAGCHASATVAIRVRHDGRGTVTVGVTLDREARLALAGAALNPGASTPDVPLDDLRTAGWTVSPWKTSGDGGSSVALSKGFAGGAGLASVLAELDGKGGALRDAHVERERSLLRERDSVSLLADLGHVRVGVIDDDALAVRLRSAGVDVGALDAGLQARVKGSFDLTVRVLLPDGTGTTVRVAPGQQRRVAAASTTDPGRRFALVIAAGAALLGLGLFVFASADARRSRRQARRERRARREREAAEAAKAEEDLPAPEVGEPFHDWELPQDWESRDDWEPPPELPDWEPPELPDIPEIPEIPEASDAPEGSDGRDA